MAILLYLHRRTNFTPSVSVESGALARPLGVALDCRELVALPEISCCVVPVLPGIITPSRESSERLPIAFAHLLLVTFALLAFA